jgi:hypothetical protein
MCLCVEVITLSVLHSSLVDKWNADNGESLTNNNLRIEFRPRGAVVL